MESFRQGVFRSRVSLSLSLSLSHPNEGYNLITSPDCVMPWAA